MTDSIETVRRFWDANPLLTGELDVPAGSKEWFDGFDSIKTNDIFAGDLGDWIPGDIAGKSVLDVGCGPGYWHRRFGERKVDYTGIDISPVTIELAKKSREIYGIAGNLEAGNAEELRFADNSFDYIVSEGVIHHTPRTEKCVDEIWRVLKPGGRATIGLYYRNYVLSSPAIFKVALFFMRILNVSLKGRGREKMLVADNASDFVRMYDGDQNPIGKSYTKKEVKAMFGKFSKIRLGRYYFPFRIFPFKAPACLQKIMASLFGLMIIIKVEK